MDVMETQCSREFSSIIQQTNGSIILDLGCGGGHRLFDFLEGCRDLHAVGLDISLSSLRGALKDAREKQLRKRTDFVLGDANFLPFRDDAFSHALVIDVLYVLESLRTIGELHRVVKPEAWLFVVEKTFNPTIARSLFRIVNQFPFKSITKKINCSFLGNYHLTKDLLTQSLKKAKFEIVEEERITYLPIGKLSNMFPIPIDYVCRAISWVNKRLVKFPIINQLSIGIALLCKNCAK